MLILVLPITLVERALWNLVFCVPTLTEEAGHYGRVSACVCVSVLQWRSAVVCVVDTEINCIGSLKCMLKRPLQKIN